MGAVKRKILIVDDEAAVRDFFARSLEPGGFDVVGVADPEEGIEKAKQIRPDIIYMSLLFPGSNGLKVGKALHSVEELKEIPIVLLTSYEGELDPKYTRTIGIVDVLVSPLRAADILAVTAKLLGEEIALGDGGLPRSAGSEIEAPAPVHDEGSYFEGSGSEVVAEGSRHSGAVSQEEGFEMTDEVEDGGSTSRRHAGSGSGKQDYEDFMAGEEEKGGEGFPDGPSEGKGGDAGGVPPVEEDSREHDEDGGYADEDFFEAYEETGRRSTIKYVLFAVLVLLVAAAVFAVLQTGIFRSGSVENRSAGVKEKAVEEEPTGEAVQPAKVESGEKSEAVEAGKQGLEEVKPPPSASTAERKVKPVVSVPESRPKVEKKISNQGRKEHGNLQGQHKEIYSVQTGAFGSKGNALSFAEKLRKRGYDAFVEKDGVAGLYRVLVGRFDDYDKALRRSKVLLRKDGIRSIVYHQ